MRLSASSALCVAAGVLLGACGDDSSSTTGTSTSSSVSASTGEPALVFPYESAGPHAVGHATIMVEDVARGRTLPVEIWYPADDAAREAAAAGEPIESFGTTQEERDQLAALLQAAPDPGTNRASHAARDATPLASVPMPWVTFSHCYNGVRFSVFTMAERLASHGIAVVAPDHKGGDVYAELAGEAAPLGKEFLETRAEDIRVLIDRALDPEADEIPEGLRGRFDPAALGVFGHSFGGVTAGRVLMLDERPRSGLALAVPMENPLLPGVELAELHVPLLFVMAVEDNSITAIGNDLIQYNFETANPPVWKVDVQDAGHWSFTDICGLVEGFRAGCTDDDVRQTTKEAFTYIDPGLARDIGAAYVTAFFLSTLRADAEAGAYLADAHPAGTVSVSVR